MALHAAGVEPGRAVVATKWMPVFRTASSISKTIHDRVSALDPYPIDLHQIHNPGSFSSIRAQIERMGALVKEGKVGSIGVSNFSARQFAKAEKAAAKMGLSVASNQMQFSLLHRKIENNGVLQAAKDSGATIIAYSPLSQGILTGKFHHDPELIKSRPGPRRYLKRFKRAYLEKTRPLIDVLRRVAESKGEEVTPTQIALAWTVQFHGDTVVAIPGASKVEQARGNAAALNVRLTDEELHNIDRTSQQVLATL
jgi:aryl-alcohol dehydrogenase-like predicted oxidoreductase